MDSQTRALFTPTLKSSIFSWLQEDEAQAVDLEGFENFVFGVGDSVYRMTWKGHRTQGQLLGELEFLDHLGSFGAPAVRCLPLPDGSRLKQFGEFNVARFERIHGEPGYAEDHIKPGVVRQWGKSLGEFHQAAKHFSPEYPRWNWKVDDNHQFAVRIPAEQQAVLQVGADVMAQLDQLPVTSENYGLIHSDAHLGNFLVTDAIQAVPQLSFFDFDDCLYAWFGYDLATILFGVALQPWASSDPDESAEELSKFLDEFLEGYVEESPTEGLMLQQMPLFLKLRELSLYAVVHAFMDLDDLDWFPARFMEGRRARIEAGKPYLSIDFSGYG